MLFKGRSKLKPRRDRMQIVCFFSAKHQNPFQRVALIQPTKKQTGGTKEHIVSGQMSEVVLSVLRQMLFTEDIKLWLLIFLYFQVLHTVDLERVTMAGTQLMSVLNPCIRKSYCACRNLSNGRHMITFKKPAINHAKKWFIYIIHSIKFGNHPKEILNIKKKFVH